MLGTSSNARWCWCRKSFSLRSRSVWAFRAGAWCLRCWWECQRRRHLRELCLQFPRLSHGLLRQRCGMKNKLTIKLLQTPSDPQWLERNRRVDDTYVYPKAFPPFSLSSFTVSKFNFSLMSQHTTVEPNAEYCSASSLPMPWPVPVMSTISFETSFSSDLSAMKISRNVTTQNLTNKNARSSMTTTAL